MACRYGVELILPPDFTLMADQARQHVCRQYASYVAEMFMIHITVADFFGCAPASIPTVRQGLQQIAAASQSRSPRFTLWHSGINVFPNDTSAVFLDFKAQSVISPILALHNDVIDLLQATPGVVPNTAFARQNYW